MAALSSAREELERGAHPACIVGGVDSYLDAATLGWLDEHGQMLRGNARSAFVPGEAAGCCVIAGRKAMNNFRGHAKATVRAIGLAHEKKLIKTDAICLGEGLSVAVKGALENLSLPSERISDVLCDINGERYRGEEWGFASLRLSSYFEDPTAYRAPAESWGDVGAASGPLFAILACEAAARGYARGSYALLWMSSERGLRGAAVLETKTDHTFQRR